MHLLCWKEPSHIFSSNILPTSFQQPSFNPTSFFPSYTSFLLSWILLSYILPTAFQTSFLWSYILLSWLHPYYLHPPTSFLLTSFLKSYILLPFLHPFFLQPSFVHPSKLTPLIIDVASFDIDLWNDIFRSVMFENRSSSSSPSNGGWKKKAFETFKIKYVFDDLQSSVNLIKQLDTYFMHQNFPRICLISAAAPYQLLNHDNITLVNGSLTKYWCSSQCYWEAAVQTTITVIIEKQTLRHWPWWWHLLWPFFK